jgi:acetyl esterase
MMAAEFDVLRDEDRAYTERLEQAGVPVQYTECEGMIHAFFGLAGMDRTRNGIGKAVDALRSAFP